MGYSFYHPPENKVFVAQNVEFFKNSLITQEASGSSEDLTIIQEEDTHHDEDNQEIDEPQSDIIPIRRSTRIQHAPNRMCLNIKDDEYELGIRAIRILIAITAFYDYEIWQMDVKTAFLNGLLSEEVYMVQPKASRNYITSLILYVDDILIMGNHIPLLQDVKSYIGKCLAMKDLEEVAYILGIKIYRDGSRRLIGLCQSAYIEKILKIFFMENSKRESIPMQEKLKLSKSQGASTPAEVKRMQNVPYALAVGSIMYAVRCTRLDVVFAQNITSRFQQNPGKLHRTAVKNILKYLRNTKDMFLVYRGDIKRELRVSCYTDAGYLTDADDLKSQTRYVFVLNRGITKGARHYHAKVHYLREVIEFGDVKIEKVHTNDNLADPFTKALAFPKHSEHTKNIGMLPASSLM
ncbi:retrotransposon protein, putative, ty1-copia subclass [Tanacetum coccineum]